MPIALALSRISPPSRTRRSVRLVTAVLAALPLLPLVACAQEQIGDGRVVVGVPIVSESSPAGAYLAGRFALETGDLAVAADDFGAALKADPDNLEIRRQVFLLRLAAGDYPEALDAARGLVELGRDADEARLLLGLERMKAGQPDAAQAEFARIGSRSVIALPLPVIDAWAEFAAGARSTAIAAIGAPDRSQGLAVLRTYHQAAMLGLDGRPAEGLALLAPGFDGTTPAPLRLVQIRTQLEVDAGELEAARGTVDAALRATPDDPQLATLKEAVEAGRKNLAPIRDPLTGMADALIGVAEALGEQQGTAEGLLLARAGSYVAPEMPDTQLVLARLLLIQDKPAEAARTLERIDRGSPQAWSARLLQAQAYEDSDQDDVAVRELTAMAAERPERVEAVVALADLYRRDERYAEAEKAYGEAITRRPGDSGRDWRLHYARGVALERLKRWPEAEAALLQALELEPEQPMILNYLGYSWVDQGLNLDRAKAMLHKAVELRPEDGYIVDSLGWAYFRLGEFDRAVTYLEKAVELEPGDATVNDHLGDAYWRAGRQREARFQWERALTFKPEPEIVGQIEAKLQRGLPPPGSRNG